MRGVTSRITGGFGIPRVSAVGAAPLSDAASPAAERAGGRTAFGDRKVIAGHTPGPEVLIFAAAGSSSSMSSQCFVTTIHKGTAIG